MVAFNEAAMVATPYTVDDFLGLGHDELPGVFIPVEKPQPESIHEIDAE